MVVVVKYAIGLILLSAPSADDLTLGSHWISQFRLVPLEALSDTRGDNRR